MISFQEIITCKVHVSSATWRCDLQPVTHFTVIRRRCDEPPRGRLVILFDTLWLKSTEITFKILLSESNFRVEGGGDSLPFPRPGEPGVRRLFARLFARLRQLSLTPRVAVST